MRPIPSTTKPITSSRACLDRKGSMRASQTPGTAGTGGVPGAWTERAKPHYMTGRTRRSSKRKASHRPLDDVHSVIFGECSQGGFLVIQAQSTTTGGASRFALAGSIGALVAVTLSLAFLAQTPDLETIDYVRSEERRVGKECRYRW